MAVSVGRHHVLDLLVTLILVAWMTSSGVIVFPHFTDIRRLHMRADVPADSPALVDWVRSRLWPPSSLPYNLSKPDDECWGQAEQIRVVQALTRNKTGGFFIESGALDGERLSNTLVLERRFGWTGLLVEPAESNFQRLVSKRRRAWALQACLSHTAGPFTTVFHMTSRGESGTVEDGLTADRLRSQEQNVVNTARPPRQHRATCVPIAAVLRALNRTSVDFFSLDIEGPEMGVLAHIPWNELDIKILLVENLLLFSYNPQMDQMRDLMESQGYIAMRLTMDWIFVKRNSEYSKNAEEIIRQTRREILRKTENIYFPFND
ncbi:uncharacterized protein LOC122373234 isoform X1 [Amphibalanus amphitrite]|uniref:uncharacterized protein LOC122373234 isoform X1 n=1 Tax=Amphibalanus amphitrite TaxID=1232801 RepID=UPI001C920D68|nr:uncharacterized protein LOC122373234 isoform X1 [Amphibalanus amphitrite]